jgi:hypothetical protein
MRLMRRVVIVVLEVALVALALLFALTAIFGFAEFSAAGVVVSLFCLVLMGVSLWAWSKVAHSGTKLGMDRGWWTRAYHTGILRFLTAALVAGLAVGIWCSWHFLISLPRTYDRLERDGVRVPATVGYVDPAGSNRFRNNDYYTLTFHFRGRRYQERAFENFRQFDGVALGDEVPVLVDPDDPGTAFSVADVRARTNSGIGLGSAASLFDILLCGWFLVGEISAKKWSRRLRRPAR